MLVTFYTSTYDVILTCSSVEWHTWLVYTTKAVSSHSWAAVREGGGFRQQEEEGADADLYPLWSGQTVPLHHLQQSQGATGVSHALLQE